jgi:hypothetical protein
MRIFNALALLSARFSKEVARRQEETARQMKATDDKISKLGDRFSEMKVMIVEVKSKPSIKGVKDHAFSALF